MGDAAPVRDFPTFESETENPLLDASEQARVELTDLIHELEVQLAARTEKLARMKRMAML